MKRRSPCGIHVMLAVWIIIAVSSCLTCTRGDRLVASDGTVNWNRYYSNAETNSIMREFTKRYPDLTRLYSIGKSYKGVDLMLMEVTNRKNRPPEEKPALYLDGGIHSGELTASAVALYAMGYLLKNYGKDPQVTLLLDTRTFYIRPKFNPDGSDLALLHDQSLRSTVHPVDSDEDGVPDDDPPDDVNGDGWITQMRIKDPNGTWKISPDDPRIMVQRSSGDTSGTFYRLMGEDIDNDGDGRFSEDGIGGVDMNRNFPRNWEPEYLQDGAGDFPISEPETYATVAFINEHPNIMSIIHGHTSGGFVYRLPSAEDPATLNKDDIALIIKLGEKYTETTGRRVNPSSTHPTDHRYGTLISWGYWDRGVIGWVPEYVPSGYWWKDYDGNGRVSEAERHRFNDEELGGKYFSNWTPCRHPQFGEVEIGGWHTKFTGQNPPAEFLEIECSQQIPWILYLAEVSPQLEITAPTITPLGENQFRIEATISNSGYLPTNLTERGYVGRAAREGRITDQIVKPVEAHIAVSGCTLVEGTKKVVIGHLAGSNPFSKAVTERSKTVSWVVKKDAPTASVRITAVGVKSGTVRTEEVSLEKQ